MTREAVNLDFSAIKALKAKLKAKKPERAKKPKYKNPWANWEPKKPRPEGPDLVPMYGASTVSLKLLTCKGVHPCRFCEQTGFVGHAPCEKCRGTGVADLRKGSMLYCECCSKSGMDHVPIMRRDPKTDPKPDPEPPAQSQRSPRS